MNQLRILHVYGGSLFGGIETMLVTIARRQADCPSLAHEFALSGEGLVGPALEAAGGLVHQLPLARASRPLTVKRARRALADLLAERRFDRVVCHAAWPYAIFAKPVRDCHVPLLFWVHNVMTGTHWTERWAAWTPPDLAVCNSRFSAASLNEVFRDVPSIVILPPLDMRQRRLLPAERARVRAEFATPDDALVIVLPARLEAMKGHAVLLDALARLRDLPWIFWQVGGAQQPSEDSYLIELKTHAARLGSADRVRFLGQRTDVPRLLAAADLHCQPNTAAEAFGLVFVEALAAGLPVVGTDLGGVREIVDDTCGVLVAPGDVAALTDALRGLLTDPARRAALAAAAPARARQLCDPAVQLQTLHLALSHMNGRRDAA